MPDSRQATALRIACFISPHGFGHAARAAAVMEALGTCRPLWHFDVFTTVPAPFFADSLSVSYTLYPVKTDVGLVQKSAFAEDLNRTRESLNAFLPFDPASVADLSRTVTGNRCDAILCDIAPLGIAVGHHSGLPTVLIENFTWDRIYSGYPSLAKALQTHIDYLRRLFAAVDHHIQTEPVCFRADADLTVGPVSRRFRTDRDVTRRRLGISNSQRAVLITTGGIPERYHFLDRLVSVPDTRFIIPGSSRRTESQGNLIFLAHHSEFFHPDLVNASDVVIGKAGYSTIAEVYTAGIPFGYAAREHYPESPGLIEFIQREMDAVALTEDDFYSGRWLESLPLLSSLPRRHRRGPNGSDEVAAYIMRAFDEQDIRCKTTRGGVK